MTGPFAHSDAGRAVRAPLEGAKRALKARGVGTLFKGGWNTVEIGALLALSEPDVVALLHDGQPQARMILELPEEGR